VMKPIFFKRSRLVVPAVLLAATASISLSVFIVTSSGKPKNRGFGTTKSSVGVLADNDMAPLVEDASIFGTKWRLTHIGSANVKTTKPYIELDAPTRRFSGDGSCNRISGGVEVNGNRVKFSRIISTRRACLDAEIQKDEVNFIAGLERATTFFIKDDVMRLYASGVAILSFKSDAPVIPAKSGRRSLQANSLCGTDEQIVFSCRLRRPAKIVSLCASPDLERERGYLQYRFGLPARIELEFPKNRQSTQQQFAYTHYFRYQVDLTEINFTIDGNQYQIFDAYNGEEKPRVIQYGLQVVPARRGSKSFTYHCRTKPKADYSKLADALKEH
jgi:heat shock protein HslJ